jgi:hypothetical protein
MQNLKYPHGLRVEARVIGMCIAHPAMPLHRGMSHNIWA